MKSSLKIVPSELKVGDVVIRRGDTLPWRVEAKNGWAVLLKRQDGGDTGWVSNDELALKFEKYCEETIAERKLAAKVAHAAAVFEAEKAARVEYLTTFNLRDQFAAAALATMAIRLDVNAERYAPNAARLAYTIADAMLKERAK